MKRFVFPILAAAVLLMASCEGNKKEVDLRTDFQKSLTAEDTTAMLQLTDSCMQLLKAQKIDQVLDLLVEYDDSTKSVTPIPDELRKGYEGKFKMFPVVDYERSYYSFKEEGLNDVRYDVTFGTEEMGSPKTAYMFNPVKVDGKWYVSVKQSSQEIDEMNR